MIYWAIKYLPMSGRGAGFIDERTISTRRKWTLAAFDKGQANATDVYKRKLRARRRSGHIRVVKVKIVEVAK